MNSTLIVEPRPARLPWRTRLATRALLGFTLVVLATLALAFASFAARADLDPSGLRVLILSAEYTGVFHTGGLGHATTGLAKALGEAGVRADVLMPEYSSVTWEMERAGRVRGTHRHYDVALHHYDGRSHKSSRFWLNRIEGTESPLYTLKHDTAFAPNYFDNFTGSSSKIYSYADREIEAMGAWGRAAAHFIQDTSLHEPYDLVILSDWPSGMAAVQLQEERMRGARTPKMLCGIHNLGFLGEHGEDMMRILGIPWEFFHDDGLRHKGGISLLKACMEYADAIYTVSATYSREIQLQRFGGELAGLVRKKDGYFRVTGIPNGIDRREWDPKRLGHEGLIPFSSRTLVEGKAAGKRLLQERFGLPVRDDVPVYVLTSRVSSQKGFDYLPGAIRELAAREDIQVIFIGSGEDGFVGQLRSIAGDSEAFGWPGKVRYAPYSAELERLATAYGDFFVNGAWYEPCGLNQMFAMAMGTLPIVSATGGLLETVRHGFTGFHVPVVTYTPGGYTDNEATRREWVRAIGETARLYRERPETVLRMRRAAMRVDNSWSRRVPEYLALFDYVLREGPSILTDLRIDARGGEGRTPTELMRELSCRLELATRPPAAASE